MPKPAGTRRIICLGASTTEGTFNADDETYPYYLEFMEFAKDLDCSVGFAGDCWSLGYPTWISWLGHQSAIVATLSEAYRRTAPIRPFNHRFDAAPPKPSAIRFAQNLRRLVRETRMRGVPLVLSSFASVVSDELKVDRRKEPGLYADLAVKWYPLTPSELARVYGIFNSVSARVAAGCEVPYVDVAAGLPREPRVFAYDTIHLSAEGNRQLASQFAKALGQDDVWRRPPPGRCD